ncbi:MAG: 7-cyano-7-deazaguanine synthase [Nanoarchaeota archaeon]|nr:7-cyano-7-deazaguanine synthase [Nanoarchaeota archaeon]
MKGLLLLSGGHDSIVAGHLIQEKKVEVIGLHFYTNEKQLELAERLAKKVRIKKIYIVPHAPSLTEFMEKADKRYVCIYCKRLMHCIAEKIAEKEGCEFLITGENLGQVASQTLDNIKTIDTAVKIKVVRPLLGLDKTEIVDIAKDIGTFDISKEPSSCCDFVPKHPVTKCTPERIEEQEAKIDVVKIIEDTVKTIKVKNL